MNSRIQNDNTAKPWRLQSHGVGNFLATAIWHRPVGAELL